MVNLNSSVIIFFREDSEDRTKNLKILLDFYYEHYENFHPLLISQGMLSSTANDIMISQKYNLHEFNLPEVDKAWNKMECYNHAIQFTEYENLIFNDVDVIFNPEAVKESLEILHKDNRKVLLPNDGHFICIGSGIRDEFAINLNYNYLLESVDKGTYDTVGDKTDTIYVGATTSPGGGFIIKKRVLYNCNGFNPNFKGWGFEDNETLLRFNKLGYPVCRLSGSVTNPMFHMDHNEAERETNPHYKINENIYKFVSKLDSKLLYLYSNTWKM